MPCVPCLRSKLKKRLSLKAGHPRTGSERKFPLPPEGRGDGSAKKIRESSFHRDRNFQSQKCFEAQERNATPRRRRALPRLLLAGWPKRKCFCRTTPPDTLIAFDAKPGKCRPATAIVGNRNSPDTRHDALFASLARAGRALIGRADRISKSLKSFSSDTPCREIKPCVVLKFVHHCQRQT